MSWQLFGQLCALIAIGSFFTDIAVSSIIKTYFEYKNLSERNSK